jgi:hypothetical protein
MREQGDGCISRSVMALPDRDPPREPARGQWACAVVSAGEVETRYRRTGCGPPVVVLGYEFDDEDRLPEPLGPLAGRFRVIVPDPAGIEALAPATSPEPASFPGWLRGFLEGLGIEGARVVAEAGLDAALARFVALNPGQIDRLLIIGDTSPASSEPPPVSPGDMAVWRATPKATADAIVRFLALDVPARGPPAPG